MHLGLIPLLNLPTNPFGWLGLIVLLSVVISIHELGHLMWAKWFGVGAEEFAIGFGKRLVWREWGGTIYSIRALPVGGFVKIKGMLAQLEEEQQEREEEEAAKQGKVDSMVKSAVFESSLAMKDLALWKRLLIFSGGVINNFILAIIILMGLGMFHGVYVETPLPAEIGWVGAGTNAGDAGLERGDVVTAVNGQSVSDFTQFATLVLSTEGDVNLQVTRDGQTLDLVWADSPNDVDSFLTQVVDTTPAMILDVMFNGPVERAGLLPGDLILSVNGTDVPSWMDLQPVLAAADGSEVQLQVQRDGETFTVGLVPEFKDYITDEGRWTIGFIPGDPSLGAPLQLGFTDSFRFATDKVITISWMMLEFLFKAVTFQSSFQEVKDNLGGPGTILTVSYQRAVAGLDEFLFFAAVFNVIVAVMNILPIPILDGGHCLINIIEGIRRRPIPLVILEKVYLLFFALLIGLMVTLVAKDIWQNLWRLTGSG